MAKTSNIALIADSLREIRGELQELREQINKPTHGVTARRAALNDKEVPDPTPVEIPGNARGSESIQDMIQRYIGTAMQQYAQEENLGTFEEEDDFTEDDHDELVMPSGFEVSDFDMEADAEMPPPFDVTDPAAVEPPAEPDPSTGHIPPAAPAASPVNPPAEPTET